MILLFDSGETPKKSEPNLCSISSSDGLPMSYGIESRGIRAVKLRSFLSFHTTRSEIFKILVYVVQRLDSAIHRINLYPSDKCYQSELS